MPRKETRKPLSGCLVTVLRPMLPSQNWVAWRGSRAALPPTQVRQTETALLTTAIILLILAVSAALLIPMRRRVLRLEEQAKAMRREKKTMYNFLDRIGSSITRGRDLESTIEIVVEFAKETVKSDAACLFVRDPETPLFRARVVQGLFPPLHKVGSDKLFAKRKYVAEMVKKAVVQEGDGIIGLVASRGEALLIPDASADPRLRKMKEAGIEVRDLILVPLTVRGEILGVLALVNKLGEERFNEEDKKTVMGIADQAAVTIDMVRLHKLQAEQQRLEHELELARTFQSLLLPHEIPQSEKVSIAEFYRPAREVGGDYYDFIPIDERHMGVVVGDVSGKGIPGALVMASVRATLRAEARISLSPKEVLQRVNVQAVHDTKESVFITMTYGILDTVTGKFRFCRAGHEPVICCNMQDETVKTYTPEGMALGIIEGEMFNVTEEKEIDLSEEQLIVLYTDGVIEAMNSESEEYGEKRFHKVLQGHGGAPLSQLVDRVVKDIEEFTRGLPQHDDITLVMLGWKTGPEAREHRDMELKPSIA